MRTGFIFKLAIRLAMVAFLFAGCQTSRRLAPVNLAEPGWSVQRGQGLWKPSQKAPELVGDVIIARHADGRVLVQFSKTPFPSVTAWRTNSEWYIEFQPQNQAYAGRGAPPAQLLLLQVAPALAGQRLPKSIVLEKDATAPTWHIRNRKTGESFTLFFSL